MDITVQELKAKQDNNESFILIDVRESHEHEAFNVGGQLIPLGTLPSKVEDISQYKEDEVIVYCRSGNRSAVAQQFLQGAGFKNVRNLLGGMLDWQDKFGE